MILPKIDYHSHILPCIDDGAESIEKSLMMIEKAKRYGIQAIYATPHCYMHKTNVHMFCEMRKCAYEKIKDVKYDIKSITLGGLEKCNNFRIITVLRDHQVK